MKKILYIFALLPLLLSGQTIDIAGGNYLIDAPKVIIGNTLEDEDGINILKPPHMWGRFADSAVTVAITQNVWAQVTNASDSLFRILETVDMTVDADTIFATKNTTAHYIVTCDLTFDGVVGKIYSVRIMTDQGEISKMNFSFGAASTYNAISCPAYWETTGTGDKLWIEVTNTTDGSDLTVHSGIITVKFYHGIY